MVSDSKIAQLMEMGFSRDDSLNALESSADNLETAIGILFGEAALPPPASPPSLAPPPPPPPRPVGGRGSVPLVSVNSGVSLHHDENINTEVRGALAAAPSLPPRQFRLDPEITSHIQPYTESTPATWDLYDNEKYEVLEDEAKYAKERFVPLVLLPSTRYLDAFLAPLLMVLQEVPAFRQALFSVPFDDYGYIPGWFKGVRTLREGDARFTMETQRLVAFLYDSDRWFASTKGLSQAYTSDLQKELQNVQTMDEFLDVVVAQLEVEVSELNPAAGAVLAGLFQSEVYDGAALASTRQLKLDDDDVRLNLYESFVSLIWNYDISRIKQVYVTQLSDILTIPVVKGAHHNDTAPSLTLEERFYPQVFTQAYLDFVIKCEEERLAEIEVHRKTAAEMERLTRYKGVPLNAILKTSIEFLEQESTDDEVLPSLRDLQTSNHRAVLTLKGKIEGASKPSLYATFSYGELLQLAMGPECPQPYLLTGVVVSWNQFYYLTRRREEPFDPLWVHVRYTGRTGSSDFSIETVPFSSVAEAVRRPAEPDADVVTLFYVKEDSWRAQSTELPIGLQSFIHQDNEAVVAAVTAALDGLDTSDSLLESVADMATEEGLSAFSAQPPPYGVTRRDSSD